MPSPFPGMDLFLEENPILRESHIQMLTRRRVGIDRRLAFASGHYGDPPPLRPDDLAWTNDRLREHRFHPS